MEQALDTHPRAIFGALHAAMPRVCINEVMPWFGVKSVGDGGGAEDSARERNDVLERV